MRTLIIRYSYDSYHFVLRERWPFKWTKLNYLPSFNKIDIFEKEYFFKFIKVSFCNKCSPSFEQFWIFFLHSFIGSWDLEFIFSVSFLSPLEIIFYFNQGAKFYWYSIKLKRLAFSVSNYNFSWRWIAPSPEQSGIPFFLCRIYGKFG